MISEGNGKGKIILTDRRMLIVDGVNNVLSFDDGYVLLSTALGDLCVEGEDLKIENLTKERGEISVSGTVSALYYREKTAKKRKRGVE